MNRPETIRIVEVLRTPRALSGTIDSNQFYMATDNGWCQSARPDTYHHRRMLRTRSKPGRVRGSFF